MGSPVADAAEALARLFPKTGVLLGVFAEPGTNTAEEAVGNLEQEIGRPFYLDHQYYQWQDAIPTAYESWTVSRGRIPFVAWKPKNTSFSNVFSGFYAWGTNHPKPLLIAEFGCMEDPAAPDRKAQWFLDIPAVLQQWPAIKDICYFNHHDPVYPWNLDSSAAALNGFQTMAGNAYLNPPRPVLLDCFFSAGQAQLRISGCVGSPCRIEVSDSLQSPNWTTLTNLALSNSPCLFSDPNPVGGVSRRFYRCQ